MTSRDKIYNFITRGITKALFDNFGGQSGFISYENFLDHNKVCVGKLSESEMKFMLVMCEKLTNGSIDLLDDESHFDFSQANSFYYNKYEKLVLVGYPKPSANIVKFDAKFMRTFVELGFDGKIETSICGPFYEKKLSKCNINPHSGNLIITHVRNDKT
jgi:hypothetical protein